MTEVCFSKLPRSRTGRWLPLCVALCGLLASCHDKPEIAADQEVPVQLRAPNRIHEPASVAVSGAIEANVTALTAFEVSGRVARVYVEEGQHVRRGQLLAELDPTDYRNAYDAAAGQARSAEAGALQAENGVRPQELEQARIDFERAADEHRRQKYLYEHQSLAANDFHKVEAAYQAAKQRYDMAQQGSRYEVKQSAGGQAHAARAQLREARKRLSDCQLRAPIDGYVGMRRVNVGDAVAAGNPVFSVLDLDPVKALVGVPEAEIGLARKGARALVVIPALNNRSFEGRVEAVGVAADASARTFNVKIAVPNGAHELRAGMVSESRIFGADEVDALTVPAAAVLRDARGFSYVYVYDAGRRRVYSRRVELGSLVNSEVEIKAGLAASDQVVVSGQQNLREGSSALVVGVAR